MKHYYLRGSLIAILFIFTQSVFSAEMVLDLTVVDSYSDEGVTGVSVLFETQDGDALTTNCEESRCITIEGDLSVSVTGTQGEIVRIKYENRFFIDIEKQSAANLIMLAEGQISIRKALEPRIHDVTTFLEGARQAEKFLNAQGNDRTVNEIERAWEGFIASAVPTSAKVGFTSTVVDQMTQKGVQLGQIKHNFFDFARANPESVNSAVQGYMMADENPTQFYSNIQSELPNPVIAADVIFTTISPTKGAFATDRPLFELNDGIDRLDASYSSEIRSWIDFSDTTVESSM